jgi:hypothetical protein
MGPDVSTWQAIMQVLYNPFFEAILRKRPSGSMKSWLTFSSITSVLHSCSY